MRKVKLKSTGELGGRRVNSCPRGETVHGSQGQRGVCSHVLFCFNGSRGGDGGVVVVVKT